MYVEPYRTCLDCGGALESTTQYRQHAYCTECNGSIKL